MDAIRTSAKTALIKAKEKHADPLALFDNMKFFYSDLVLVEDQLASRFPPDWKVSKFRASG